MSFLIYRVELKVGGWCVFQYSGKSVPNLPCGVESHSCTLKSLRFVILFLIYRVELKAINAGSLPYGLINCS